MSSTGLYPSLHERFNSEGVACSICLLEMGSMPRFSCDNSHAICQRCRAYFFNCPQCLEPLHEQLASHGQLMSHPAAAAAAAAAAAHQQPSWSLPYPPSAPNLEDFHGHERAAGLDYPRNPQRALTNADLIECPYSRSGCTAKFVAELRDMHASRCQYGHELREDEQRQHMRQVVCPAAYPPPPHEVIACRYRGQGCNVRLAAERLRGHEEICIYKDRERASPSSFDCCSQAPARSVGDVCCRHESLGCNVRLPHWRLSQHEAICVYRDREPESPSAREDDRVPCRYRSLGCQLRAPHWRLPSHEDACVYKERCQQPSWGPPQPCAAERIPCRYQPVGCNVRMPPGRLHGHEDICIYKDRY